MLKTKLVAMMHPKRGIQVAQITYSPNIKDWLVCLKCCGGVRSKGMGSPVADSAVPLNALSM